MVDHQESGHASTVALPAVLCKCHLGHLGPPGQRARGRSLVDAATALNESTRASAPVRGREARPWAVGQETPAPAATAWSQV